MHRPPAAPVFLGASLIALLFLFALASVRLEGLAGATP